MLFLLSWYFPSWMYKGVRCADVFSSCFFTIVFFQHNWVFLFFPCQALLQSWMRRGVYLRKCYSFSSVEKFLGLSLFYFSAWMSVIHPSPKPCIQPWIKRGIFLCSAVSVIRWRWFIVKWFSLCSLFYLTDYFMFDDILFFDTYNWLQDCAWI